jgi:ABC-type antimicrobial peptide transport system permease subunit
MNSLLQDIRYALRQLRKSPGFSAVAVLTLGLGICSSTAIFAFVDAALLKPLPYKDSPRLVALFESIPLGPRYHLSWPDYAIYVPFNQNPLSFFSLIVRTSQAPQSLVAEISSEIPRIDPSLAAFDGITMSDRIHDSPSAYLHRSSAWLIGGGAVLALLLGVIGLYGVVAYSVSQRTREIGVRMALGAQRSSVSRLVLKEAGWLVSVGILAGIVLALATSTLMQTLLFGVRAWDVPTIAAVAVLLAISALLASYLPARSAAKVDPMVALRYE